MGKPVWYFDLFSCRLLAIAGHPFLHSGVETVTDYFSNVAKKHSEPIVTGI
jgi:hypothetical protein